jgi:glycosyltransferase involved in cell wall biosynthesis
VYNAVAHLREAVASALAQPEVGEVLLVDDGSSDGSSALCEALAGEHASVRMLRHPRGANRGAAASRNAGLRAATFPLVAFLDADDTYLPNRFARATELLQSDATVHGVYEAIGMLPTDLPHNKPLLTTMQERCAPELLFFRISPIGNWGYFSLIGLTLRREALLKVGLLNESLPVSQDTEWMLRLSAACRLVPGSLTEPVAMRRIHARNRTAQEEKLRPHRHRMAMACLHWFSAHGMDAAQTGEVLRLYLKYRFEWVHLWSGYGHLRRKWCDVADGLRLWWSFPALRRHPLLQYHLRTTFRLPVSTHLNYYEPVG